MPVSPRSSRISSVRRSLLGATAAAVILAVAPVAHAAPTDPPGTFTEQNLVADRTANNWFYRIPALAHVGNGLVLAAQDGRPGSAADAPNANSILLRRSTDNGTSWGPQITVAAGHVADASGPRYGYSDPSFVVDHVTGEVFCFFVYSKEAGFAASVYGSDDANRNVISSAVVSSTDGGLTWSQPRLITSVTKPGSATNPQPGAVRSNFATSGEGIQLRYGPHAGRLIQQYAGYVLQTDRTTPIQAWSVYSDDHGATWVKGASVGVGMDENKVVELSDGRLMMNSRDSAGSKFRKVTISTDGGATWGPVSLDRQLPDPTNNASLSRLFPDAAQGSVNAKKLLFTNTANQTARQDVTARVSCDDGTTWPGVRLIHAGGSMYSTATRLAGGQIGVYYEVTALDDMRFARFDDAWLNTVCAPLATPDVTVRPGVTTSLPVTLTNQEATAVAGALTASAPAGWTVSTAPVGPVAAGAVATATVTLTPPANATAATLRVPVVFTAADGRQSSYEVVVTVDAPPAPLSATIVGSRGDAARDVTTQPYAAGDQVPYSFRVTSTSSVTTAVVPTAGNFSPLLPPAAGNCRYSSLAAGASFTCTTPRHTVTEAEVAQGFFSPESTWTVAATGRTTVTYTITGTEVDLKARNPRLSGTQVGRLDDTDGDGYADAGERITVTTTVTNTGNVSLTDVSAPAAGTTLKANALTAATLAPGASVTATRSYELTAADLAAGRVSVPGLAATARNGSREIAQQVEGTTVALAVAPQPTTTPTATAPPTTAPTGSAQPTSTVPPSMAPKPTSGSSSKSAGSGSGGKLPETGSGVGVAGAVLPAIAVIAGTLMLVARRRR